MRWPALLLLPILSGCAAAVAIPLVTGSALTIVTHHRVRAATPVPAKASDGRAAKKSKAARGKGRSDPQLVLTPLKELPAPSGAQSAAADPWQQFFTFALTRASAKDDAHPHSVLLVENPPLEKPALRDCRAPVPAVVIDLDPGSAIFDPRQPLSAPAGVPEGLVRLRAAGVVVLWISQLPASRAADVAQALRKARLDPGGIDQLLLIRNTDDRKQLLRGDALADVCIVAMAGDARHDFDELFDYLRQPDQAFGLDAMLGSGWFLVPSLEAPSAAPE